MTVPAVPTSSSMPVGLEDIDPSELRVPRLMIDHKKTVFRDSLSNEEWPEVQVVVLGVCNQRVLWDTTMRPNAKPMCKSLDGKKGLPADDFPWDKSGFDKPAAGDDEVLLDCAACKLKDWESHPTRPRVAWCTDQRVLAVIMDGAPYLLSIQRSGIKPFLGFVTSFVKTKTPTYTRHCTIRLTAQKTGSVDYAVPVFVVGEPTDEAEHHYYAETFLGIRSFVQTRRIAGDDDDTATAATKSAASAPVGDDEVPW